ncbi:MAG: patatin-like phospholipase family protein, partial [Spirochaetaceae bacterium]|nr:patatin-like phospholipase family protein [Spirochaetaceae bacterium]
MKWALVLSGGGARGLSYIGFLEALEKMGYPKPGLITGCSIGALIGGIYASGMTPEQMKNFLLNDFEFKQYLTSVTFMLPDNKLTKALQIGEGLSHIISKRGIESGSRILDFIRQMTNNINFEDAEIPFVCNATDLVSGKEHVFKSGNMAEAIRASIAFPGILEPIQIGDGLYVDGYVTHNTPVWIARSSGYTN